MKIFSTERPLSNITALVVDDQPADIEGTLLTLKRSGLTYRNVKDIESAEHELKKQDFDFVIVDLRLPLHKGEPPNDNAGVELIARLQRGELGKTNIDKPFIVISAQNRSVAQGEVDKIGSCWGIYGKLMHNRIVNEVQRRAEDHFKKNV